MAAKWQQGKHAPGEGICSCGCGKMTYVSSRAAVFGRADQMYREAYGRHMESGTTSAHTVAYNEVKKKFPLENCVHVGAIPGVEPGHMFATKAHAASLGVHKAIYKGIHSKVGYPTESIAMGGGYVDDEDRGNDIWYTGEGGLNSAGTQVFNQKMSPTNITLAVAAEVGTPIRVIRKQGDTARGTLSWVYDGLYQVLEWKRASSIAGPVVFKFLMRRLASETGTVSAPVRFRKGRFLGRQLASAGKSMRAAGRADIQRKRRKELLSSHSVISGDISQGLEAPWTIICMNNVNDETLSAEFEYTRECIITESARPLYDQRQANYERSIAVETGDGKPSTHDQVMKRNYSPTDGENWMPYNGDACLMRVCDCVYECGEGCEFGPACGLRLVQRGLPRDVDVYFVHGKGWGVRCFHQIIAGDFISEYCGEVISSAEANRRGENARGDEYFFDTGVVKLAERAGDDPQLVEVSDDAVTEIVVYYRSQPSPFEPQVVAHYRSSRPVLPPQETQAIDLSERSDHPVQRAQPTVEAGAEHMSSAADAAAASTLVVDDGDPLVIDGRVKGNVTRFINHRCEHASRLR
jgi:hypothetical protein